MHKGSCLCGAVSFEVEGNLPEACACHCSQCRKQSGHFWVATEVPKSTVTLHGEENLTWYHASDKARRGFCSRCGSFLFWTSNRKDTLGIAMGAFEQPTETQIGMHIFVADKGDYYEITDGVPQHQQ